MPRFRWYYVLFALPIYLLVLLPMPFIYGLSNVFYLIIYKLIGYRKKVVFENLRRSFPEKSEAWIKETANTFYLNLFDVTLETLTMAVIGPKYYAKHVHYNNIELVQQLANNNQPFILVCGHLANWEWAGQSLHNRGIQVDVIYHPLSNHFFEWFMYHIRSRFGIYPIPMKATFRELVKRKGKPAACSFVADQTPSMENCHWMEFMNQDTPVFLGAEKMAKKLNYPVVYGEMYRVKRGYYAIDFTLLSLHPNETKPNEITEAHMRLLESRIRKNPGDWLWSHRRWKHKRTSNN